MTMITIITKAILIPVKNMAILLKCLNKVPVKISSIMLPNKSGHKGMLRLRFHFLYFEARYKHRDLLNISFVFFAKFLYQFLFFK
jgi:hypothetical protein